MRFEMIEWFATCDAPIERFTRRRTKTTYEGDLVRAAARADRAFLERAEERDQIERA